MPKQWTTPAQVAWLRGHLSAHQEARSGKCDPDGYNTSLNAFYNNIYRQWFETYPLPVVPFDHPQNMTTQEANALLAEKRSERGEAIESKKKV